MQPRQPPHNSLEPGVVGTSLAKVEACDGAVKARVVHGRLVKILAGHWLTQAAWQRCSNVACGVAYHLSGDVGLYIV